MGVFDGIPGYEEHILDAGKEPLFLLLVSFLITFALTRLYTRLARIYGLGSASAGGVHLHHYVVGIFLMFSAGLAMFALQPGRIATGVLAIFFGGGAAVTLDEFALWFHLKDVYWSEEGRSSIDATVLALLVGGLILVGASPLGTGEDYDSLLGLSAYAAFHFFWVAITLLKGKLLFGVVALFLPVLGLVGGIRLAKPTSPWAKWFYRSGEGKPWYERWLFRNGERKLPKATKRSEVGWAARFKRRFNDLVGGAPSLPSSSGQESEATHRTGEWSPDPGTAMNVDHDDRAKAHSEASETRQSQTP